MYDMSNIMQYWRTLDNEGKEKLLFWVVKEMNAARSRLWLSIQINGHERASKAPQKGSL